VYDGARRAGRLGAYRFDVAVRYSLAQTLGRHIHHAPCGTRVQRKDHKHEDQGKCDRNECRWDASHRRQAFCCRSTSGFRRIPSFDCRSQPIERTEAAAERDLENRLREILVKLKEWNSDAMRLYHALRPKMPSISYDEFKRMYPELEVDFEVSMDLRRAGLLR